MDFGLYFPDKNDQSFLETYQSAAEDPTLFASLWKNNLDKPSKYEYFEKEYNIRYENPLFSMNLKPYHQKLMDAGKHWETISKYVQ
jgi:hypothetical protein